MITADTTKELADRIAPQLVTSLTQHRPELEAKLGFLARRLLAQVWPGFMELVPTLTVDVIQAARVEFGKLSLNDLVDYLAETHPTASVPATRSLRGGLVPTLDGPPRLYPLYDLVRELACPVCDQLLTVSSSDTSYALECSCGHFQYRSAMGGLTYTIDGRIWQWSANGMGPGATWQQRREVLVALRQARAATLGVAR